MGSTVTAGLLAGRHAYRGRVFGWKVSVGGELTAIGSANGLPLTAAGLAAS